MEKNELQLPVVMVCRVDIIEKYFCFENSVLTDKEEKNVDNSHCRDSGGGRSGDNIGNGTDGSHHHVHAKNHKIGWPSEERETWEI